MKFLIRLLPLLLAALFTHSLPIIFTNHSDRDARLWCTMKDTRYRCLDCDFAAIAHLLTTKTCHVPVMNR